MSSTSEHISFDDAPVPNAPIDLQALLETGLLVQANSGGGKTWANRRLLEQTYGHVQHVVIDPEGEMHTLRERFDYVLAAPSGGDCLASVDSAPLLARRIMEMGISIIVDIYDLGPKRPAFLKAFIEAFMVMPRNLWHPAMFLIEEASTFCPERGYGDAVSTEAVMDLMTRGRKRGWGRVLSTQRIATLHKSAAAECNNKLIGRTALENDIDRAKKALGLRGRKDADDMLASLPPGQFFAFGPALCPKVTQIKIGAVQTTHLRAGAARRGPTPPRERVRQVLAQLADIPKEAAAEAKTVDELRARVRELEAKGAFADQVASKAQLAELAVLRSERETLYSTVEKEKARAARYRAVALAIHGAFMDVEEEVDRQRDALDSLEGRAEPRGFTEAELAAARSSNSAVTRGIAASIDEGRKAKASTDRVNGTHAMPAAPGAELSKLESALLTALAQHGNLTKSQMLTHAGYARSGTTNKAFGRLTREGWIALGEYVSITAAGRVALGNYEPLPTGGAMRAHILASHKFSKVEKSLFSVVCDAYPNKLRRGDVLTRAGYARSGTTNKAFGKFVSLGYFKASGGQIAAAEELF